MDTIEQLKLRIAELEAENKQLRTLLKLPVKHSESVAKEDNVYDQNQGKRIIRYSITKDAANYFYSLFWGRKDVYALRVVNKNTGKAAYYPQCVNFYRPGCYRRDKLKTSCSECPMLQYKSLQLDTIIAHLEGKKSDDSDVVGIYPLFEDGTCRFIVFDFDDHENDETIGLNEKIKQEVDALRKICILQGFEPLVERSRSGKGAHVWLLFSEPIDGKIARQFGYGLLNAGLDYVSLSTFNYFDRMLPMQDQSNKLGNLIALPLQGNALKSGNSAFVDNNWNAYKDQWLYLQHVKKINKSTLISKLHEWNIAINDQSNTKNTFDKPWSRDEAFDSGDINGSMHIVLSNGIYIDKSNIKPRLQNRIRKLALMSNPNFYKNQALDLSNYNNSRTIYLGDDSDQYIHITRGTLKALQDKCAKANIELIIEDLRCKGNDINVSFNGTLKENQNDALDSLLSVDNGILNAATAFGKTVVCCHLITQLKTSTLILVQQTTLMDQWKDSIERFIKINEPLPTYSTKKGSVKTRKSCVGLLKGNVDTTTGIIDIASVGSVCKDGKFHHRLNNYGCVILDECHHGASATIQAILQEVKAQHVYGATATLNRYDGKEGINKLLIGDVVYRFSAKERAIQQGILHLVYPRFTHCVAPTFQSNKLNANQYYEVLRNDKQRTQLIVNDVISCIQQKRTPVVLSKYKNLCFDLYDALKDKADYVFLLTGDSSRKEQSIILEQMHQVSKDETMILIATGSLIGEGFDFPRLDTLMIATPISFKGVVEQYVGRLNRDYPGKDKVIVYDYIDHHIPFFQSMYHKRLKTYRQIGYMPCDSPVDTNEVKNSIFDYESYLEPYLNDLRSATQEVYVSSPTLSKDTVDRFIDAISERLLHGVKVHVITYEVHNINYGDANYWLQLQKHLADQGIMLHFVNENCQRYCIIDKEIVWYGSLNFLGKADIEDNLMRIESGSVASELLEMTFNNPENGIDLTDKYYETLV